VICWFFSILSSFGQSALQVIVLLLHQLVNFFLLFEVFWFWLNDFLFYIFHILLDLSHNSHLHLYFAISLFKFCLLSILWKLTLALIDTWFFFSTCVVLLYDLHYHLLRVDIFHWLIICSEPCHSHSLSNIVNHFVRILISF